jgi:hypothetical protein
MTNDDKLTLRRNFSGHAKCKGRGRILNLHAIGKEKHVEPCECWKKYLFYKRLCENNDYPVEFTGLRSNLQITNNLLDANINLVKKHLMGKKVPVQILYIIGQDRSGFYSIVRHLLALKPNRIGYNRITPQNIKDALNRKYKKDSKLNILDVMIDALDSDTLMYIRRVCPTHPNASYILGVSDIQTANKLKILLGRGKIYLG